MTTRGGLIVRTGLVLFAGLLLALMGLLASGPVRADPKTIHVWCGNTSGIEDGSQTYPYNTIGEGLEAASNGDVILVAQGIYTETVYIRESVLLEGGYEPTTWARDISAYTTTIRPSSSSSGRVVYIGGHLKYALVLDGFTITGGRGKLHAIEVGAEGPVVVSHNTITDNTAGGIHVGWGKLRVTIQGNTIVSNTALRGAGIETYAHSSTIIDNHIEGNSASSDGGGIYFQHGATAIITGNTVISNTADRGGGLYLGGSTWARTIVNNTVAGNTARLGGGFCLSGEYVRDQIRRNHIYDNSAQSGGGLYIGYSSSPLVDANSVLSNTATYGGGAYIWDLSTPSLTNNFFARNSATWGAGLYSQGSYPSLVNNTFAQNEGEGIYLAHNFAATLTNNIIVSHTTGVIASYTVTPTLSHNNVWGNSLANYSGIVTGTNGISADPLFVNPTADDYHLQASSSCIDAGTDQGAPSTDFDGQSRPFDGDEDSIAATDIGADEYFELTLYFPMVLKGQ